MGPFKRRALQRSFEAMLREQVAEQGRHVARSPADEYLDTALLSSVHAGAAALRSLATAQRRERDRALPGATIDLIDDFLTAVDGKPPALRRALRVATYSFVVRGAAMMERRRYPAVMDIAARVLGVGNAFEERLARYSPPPDLEADDSSYEFLRTSAAAVLGAAQDGSVDERGEAFGPAVADWTRAFDAGARAFADVYPRVLSERVFWGDDGSPPPTAVAASPRSTPAGEAQPS